MPIATSTVARAGAKTTPRPASLKARTASPHVVVIGGGFGGLAAAQALANAPVRVTVIDKSNHHVFQPMLYQVATGQLSGDQIAAPIRNILRKQKNTDVLLGEITGVDTRQKRVLMGETPVPYDYLIISTGSHYNYFGHPEWEEFAPSLKNLNDATRIRANILQAFEEAEKAVAEERATPEEVQAMLTFALVGAGPTGVEMCGAIAELARTSMAHDFRHIDPKSARVLLLESDTRILGGFPEDLAADTLKKLDRMGVEVKTGAKVEQVDAEGVIVNGERIKAGTVLWTAGTVGSAAGQWLNAETDKADRVKVGPDLSVPNHPEIFVIGDTAYTGSHGVKNLFFQPEPDSDKPLPGVAQPAMQMGTYAGKLIRRRVEGFNAPPPFRYWDKGNLATVGRSFAVADLGSDLKFTGFFAWVLWLGIHIFYLIGFENRFIVLAQWAWTYFTHGRSVRVFEPTEHASDVANSVMKGLPTT